MSQAPLFGASASAAEIDTTGTYRYTLDRQLSASPYSRRLLWIMLNPSTADASVDDPTIRRCLSFTRDWGFDELRVVNLFALRATDPRELRSHPDPVGPLNDERIVESSRRADVLIAAWGVHGAYQGRGRKVAEMIAQAHGRGLCCLGTTKEGHPRHPLYLRSDSKLEPLPLEAAS